MNFSENTLELYQYVFCLIMTATMLEDLESPDGGPDWVTPKLMTNILILQK